jgi:hypothetical protein
MSDEYRDITIKIGDDYEVECHGILRPDTDVEPLGVGESGEIVSLTATATLETVGGTAHDKKCETKRIFPAGVYRLGKGVPGVIEKVGEIVGQD